LRHDDPEKLISIAGRWEHVEKFKLHTPVSGTFFDATTNIDVEPPRTIVIRVVATECQRGATFRIWSDEAKALHLDFISYVV
jgi:hypothetical protein